ncbi:hypothetical protein BU15DRAFT_67013 [Melanogaster broomeanus]|nr:hypothetical protein BU15DRAFT_67013 [Melanogaster broomeanus]
MEKSCGRRRSEDGTAKDVERGHDTRYSASSREQPHTSTLGSRGTRGIGGADARLILAFELYTKTDEDAIRPTNVVDLPAEAAKRRVLEVIATNSITKEVQSH